MRETLEKIVEAASEELRMHPVGLPGFDAALNRLANAAYIAGCEACYEIASAPLKDYTDIKCDIDDLIAAAKEPARGH